MRLISFSATMRLILVWSSLSPLFILLAIRGNPLLQDLWLVTGCVAMFTLPNVYLGLMIWYHKRTGTKRSLYVVESDSRDKDIVSYLFAVLLPFYVVDLSTWRDAISSGAAFLLVFIMFVGLRLHYMNVLAVLWRRRIYAITVKAHMGSDVTTEFMLVTKNLQPKPNSRINGIVVGDSILLE